MHWRMRARSTSWTTIAWMATSNQSTGSLDAGCRKWVARRETRSPVRAGQRVIALPPNRIRLDALVRDPERPDEAPPVEAHLVDAHHAVIPVGLAEGAAVVDDIVPA
jgi:hypothetical protein